MVIGIDTSGSVCSVACVDGAKLLFEFSVDHKKTHSEALMPMLETALSKSGLSVDAADCIAVANGPGSFTGLRIGAAAAKGLGLAMNKPVIGVPTLLSLAYNLSYCGDIVCPIMDARRNEVYTAAYSFDLFLDNPVQEIIAPCAVPLQELLDKLKNFSKRIVFLGDGVPVYKDIIEESLDSACIFALPHLNKQRASSVAVLGQKEFEKEDFTPGALSLSYLRRPQAERERLENEKNRDK